jgi:hypothetical protein
MSVPRVAKSFDDLRVGQSVAYVNRESSDIVRAGRLSRIVGDKAEVKAHGGDFHVDKGMRLGEILILQEAALGSRVAIPPERWESFVAVVDGHRGEYVGALLSACHTLIDNADVEPCP